MREVPTRVVVESEETLVVRRLADARPVRSGDLCRVLDAELFEHLRLDARREYREVREEVRVGARVRLHVRVFRAEDLACEPGRLALDVVDVLAPCVEPMRGITLRVLVGEQRSLCKLCRQRAVVLARDELQVGALIVEFVDDGGCDARRYGRDVIEHRVQSGGRRNRGMVADALEVLR